MAIFKPSGHIPVIIGVEAMQTFSQRMGLTLVKNIIQKESIDDDLKNGLWNAQYDFYWSNLSQDRRFDSYTAPKLFLLCEKIWKDYFKKRIDTMSIGYAWASTYEVLSNYFYSSEWNKVYDFVEFVANNYSDDAISKKFIEQCNKVLTKELSAYRFIGEIITPITSEQEIQQIEEAIARTDTLTPVQEHLTTALKFLSDRKKPDYRNSIKESISSVEGLCNLIAGTSSDTLGQTLKLLEKQLGLHGALKNAYSSLYGWTSDADGIRHAMMDEPHLDFEDAKFMLVSCSAFINYLIVKAQKVGIENF